MRSVCSADSRGDAVYTEYFAKGTVPTEVCDHHTRATVCSDSGMLATEYCPNRTTGVFMTIPAGETTVTDDSLYALPDYCTMHSSSSVIISPNTSGSVIFPGSGSSTDSPATYRSPSAGTSAVSEYEDDVISAAPPPG